MKKLILLLVVASLASCNSDSGSSNGEGNKSIAFRFMDNPAVLLEVEGNPIITLKENAEATADEVLSLDRANVKEVIAGMKNSSSWLIIVGDHTAVRSVKGAEADCKVSGSWGECMPLVEGYVRSDGAMKAHGDYMNNVIGLPDDQERWVFLYE